MQMQTEQILIRIQLPNLGHLCWPGERVKVYNDKADRWYCLGSELAWLNYWPFHQTTTSSNLIYIVTLKLFRQNEFIYYLYKLIIPNYLHVVMYIYAPYKSHNVLVSKKKKV